MTRATAMLVSGFVCAAVLVGTGQTGLDPAKLLKPGTDSWPSYNGDYSGRRFSPLAKINDRNITSLSLGWVYRLNSGLPPGAGGGGMTLKGTPLMIDGVLYLTAPDHVWAVDARTGREIWHHTWQAKGGITIGNRGAAVLRDSLYFVSRDCNLVSLNVKDGTERWRKQICDLDQYY
jgi:alcohol dehydrogenase (cytochrome c)